MNDMKCTVCGKNEFYTVTKGYECVSCNTINTGQPKNQRN